MELINYIFRYVIPLKTFSPPLVKVGLTGVGAYRGEKTDLICYFAVGRVQNDKSRKEIRRKR